MFRRVELIDVVNQCCLFAKGVQIDDQRVGRAVEIPRLVEKSAAQRTDEFTRVGR